MLSGRAVIWYDGNRDDSFYAKRFWLWYIICAYRLLGWRHWKHHERILQTLNQWSHLYFLSHLIPLFLSLDQPHNVQNTWADHGSDLNMTATTSDTSYTHSLPGMVNETWIATHHDCLSNFLCLNGLLHTTEVGVKATLQTGHQLYSGFVTCIDSLYKSKGGSSFRGTSFYKRYL